MASRARALGCGHASEPAYGSPHLPRIIVETRFIVETDANGKVLVAADDVRTRLRRRLAEEYGMDEADLLLDRPPGGWDDLVTKEWLHLELAAFRSEFDPHFVDMNARLTSLEQAVAQVDSRLDRLSRDLHSQTWRLVIVLMTGMSVAIGAASAIAVVS